MAFLLRQISHSADGREIVRPSRVEGDRLTIGRDPGCDVHLTDLAVALTIPTAVYVRIIDVAGAIGVDALEATHGTCP